MQPAPLASRAFVNAITQIEEKLDNVVNEGNDDLLFLSSYLQGHFAVLARQLEMQPDATLGTLNDAMEQSLDSAFANNELEQDDQQAVRRLWMSLINQAQAA